MKKIILFTVFAFMFSSLAYAQAAKKDASTITITGTIIDNKSVEKYIDQLDTFTLRYPKAQAVLPISVESGYSIYSQSELYKFNKESNEKIVKFLEERNNVLRVIVEAKEVDDELELISIRNEYIGVMGEKNE